MIYKEEVSHCAAGVRWLKHLHALAHTLGQPADGAAAVGGAAAGPAPQHGQQQGQQQAATPAAPVAAAQPAAGEGQEGHLPAWAEEARRHPTVEQWFHALVRAHFRGPLKPPL